MQETIECDFIFVPDGTAWPSAWVAAHPEHLVIPARFEGSPAFMRRMFAKRPAPGVNIGAHVEALETGIAGDASHFRAPGDAVPKTRNSTPNEDVAGSLPHLPQLDAVRRGWLAEADAGAAFLFSGRQRQRP